MQSYWENEVNNRDCTEYIYIYIYKVRKSIQKVQNWMCFFDLFAVINLQLILDIKKTYGSEAPLKSKQTVSVSTTDKLQQTKQRNT